MVTPKPLSELKKLLRYHGELLRKKAKHVLSEKNSYRTKLIKVDYGYCCKPRPSLKKLSDIIHRNEESYTGVISHLKSIENIYSAINLDAGDSHIAPFWRNGWFSGLDGISLYGLIAKNNPNFYIEVGSGNSTKFVRQSIKDHSLKTKIISIDPHPRSEIDEICDTVIRQPLEEADLTVFQNASVNDVVFIDSSHRSFQNSDVTVFFTEVLPDLNQGVIYGFHDIYLPDDYPEIWKDHYYNEQYLLAAYLCGGAGGDEIILPNNYLLTASTEALRQKVYSLFEKLPGVARGGGCFWMQRANFL